MNDEKANNICSSCGKGLAADAKNQEGELYCEDCSQNEKNEKTLVSQDKVFSETGTIIEEPFSKAEKIDALGERVIQEKSDILKLGKRVPATKIIKEKLNIDPDVDLEEASKIYADKRGKTIEKDSTGSIRQLISEKGEDTKYIFDKEIGRGGMGAVFETVDQDIRRKVAMKLLRPSEGPKVMQLKRFLEEAQITGQLEHPNIVPVHEIGIDDESKVYFTMKLVRGENLDEIISKIAEGDEEYQKKYGLGTLLQIFMKVCDGISYAHSRGVLHRDLKPENIMVGDFGEALVMDWGVAKVLGRHDAQEGGPGTESAEEEMASFHTVEGQVMGTPSYMPPEQALGKISELDERSDVFSLGGILYKILTHQSPYKGETSFDKLHKAKTGILIPPNVRAPNSNIPPELNAICVKALSREKEKRYANVSELKNDLQLYLDGKSVSAKRDNIIVRTRKWIVRNKVATLGMTAALLCLVIGVILTAIYEQKKKEETILELLNQAKQASVGERYEEAEATYFSVLGLDDRNLEARNGIALVSGKALSLKNKRLAKERVKLARKIFEDRDYIQAYDAYVSVFALDPTSSEAKEGIKISAVRAEKQKAQKKITPILEETKKLLVRQKEINNTIQNLKSIQKKLKNKIEGHEGYKTKMPLWRAEKTLVEKRISNLKIEGKIISQYSTILTHDGENHEARKALSKIYYDKFVEAEFLRNEERMAYFKELILTFDDGYYRKLLDKDGTLTLTTDPKASAYYLYRFVEGPDRRMIPAPFGPAAIFSKTKKGDQKRIEHKISPELKLSQTAFLPMEKLLKPSSYNRLSQIKDITLPKGSYLIVARKDGYADARIPIQIKRGDKTRFEKLPLIKTTNIPKGFVYVPKGDYLQGGDPNAPYSVSRTEKSVPGFLISRYEVTAGEYQEFINYIEKRIPGSAKKYLPRKSARSGFYWNKSGASYKSTFPSDWPILGISWNDARAYCKWLSLKNKKMGWVFRLPEDWEWEKASRGVDGRSFPWGNYFDYRFCSMANSKKGKRDGPDRIGEFPMDESVFGARDMAGNVSEWCQSFFDKEKNIRINRGSAWSYVDPDFARCAGRNGHSPTDVADFRGFRVAVSLK